jgi:FkbM family methyltransferase
MNVSFMRVAKLIRLLSSSGGRHGLRHGVAATVEHRHALASMNFSTVIDIGANKGQFSLFALGSFPDVTIYSFEPLFEAAALFRSLMGGQRVTLFETAIGPCDTSTKIYVSRRADSSSLLPITNRQNEVFPGTELKEIRTIRVAPLNKFIGEAEVCPPALLKIDVQGFEREVLKGCDALLHLFQCVYVECSYGELYGGQALVGDIVNYLGERMFRLTGVYNQTDSPDGRPVQADFLFEKDII